MLAFTAILTSTSVRAATYFVKGDATGANNGTSWANAYTSLQPAISAVALAGSGEIWVAAGTYVPTGSGRLSTFQLQSNMTVYGGFAGTESSVSERNIRANVTILSGEIGGPGPGDNIYHVVRASGSGALNTPVLDGLTITGGNANSSFPENQGGGLLLDDGWSPTIRNCTITGNSASDNGGGAFVTAGSSAVFINCTFSNNSAGLTGGGFGTDSSGTPVLTNCLFFSNSATVAGGAVYRSIGTAVFTNCTVVNNSTGDVGGGFYFESPSVPVRNSIVRGNTPNQFDGSSPSVTYSNVQGGWAGTGNINADPLFVHPAGGNLRLSPGSPCVDAGNNSAVPGSVTTDPDGAPRFSEDPAAPNTGSGAPPIVDMGAYERVPASSYALTVIRTGAGTGTVASTPAGIDCGATCSASFDAGSIVTLTATPDPGYSFTAWSGPCSGSETCSVTMHALQYVTAGFGVVRYVDKDAVGANDGTSWSNAYVSLQAALLAATYGTELWVAAGTYKPNLTNRDVSFALKSGVGVYGGFAGGETDRSERNAALHVTTLSGDLGPGSGSDTFHVVTATSVDASAVLDGFTITSGNANGANPYGGGVLLDSSSPRIESCTITGNNAGTGGGLAARNGGSPVIRNCAIHANTANHGGGVALIAVTGTVADCGIFGNGANTFGGGMYIENGAPHMTRCDIRSNTTSAGSGGGVYSTNGSTQIRDSTIRDNTVTAGNSGGLYLSGGNPYVANTRVTGNSAASTGGVAAQGAVTLVHCTIANNLSPLGGGFFVYPGSPVFLNGIIWGNTPAQVFNGGSPSITYSDVQGGFAGAGNIDADPLFVNAAGGNYRLAGTSPANDAGSNAGAGSLLADIEGKPRRIDAPRADTGIGKAPIVDMGAYEFHPVGIAGPAPVSACLGTEATMQVTATGWGALSYQWRKAMTPIDGATSSSFTIPSVAAGDEADYDVIVTDSIGTSSTSAEAALTVNPPPSIAGFHPGSGVAGTPVTIDGDGFAGATAVTFAGTNAASFTVQSDSEISATAPVGATTGPIAVVKDGCGTATSSTSFTITLERPENVATSAPTATSIVITWSGVSGADHYEIFRSPGLGPYVLAGTSAGTSFPDAGLSPNTSYLYIVRAIDGAGNPGADSDPDLGTTIVFIDDMLLAGVTIIQAVHWTQVRTGVNALRAAAGLAPASFTDSSPAGIAVKEAHLTELRAAIDPGLAALGLPSIPYTDPAVTTGVTTVKAAHLQEIRAAVR